MPMIFRACRCRMLLFFEYDWFKRAVSVLEEQRSNSATRLQPSVHKEAQGDLQLQRCGSK